MKILVLGRNQLYKRSLGRELFKQDLSKFHNVIYYGKGYRKYYVKNVPDILKTYNDRDFILTYICAYSTEFENLSKANIPKVHIDVDYFPGGNLRIQNEFYRKSKYNIMFAPTKSMVQLMQENKTAEKVFWLPFSVNTEKYKKTADCKIIDVMTTFTTKPHWYPNRSKIQTMLKKLNVISFTKPVLHDEYIKKINQSKIFVTDNGTYNCLNMKFTEVLSCGTLLLSNKPEDFDDVGFKEGEHLVIYKDLNDMQDKINYYLKHDNEREEIAKNGMEFVRKNHSNDVRIKEMTDIIQKELK